MVKQLQWYKVADSIAAIQWQSNKMVVVEAGGKKITLATYQQHLYAFAYKCPHASGIMAEGFIDAKGHIACPLHRFRFDVKNGHNTSGEGYHLKTYPVQERDGAIYVGIEKSWLDWV